jgi:hypothetical protein
MRVGLGDHVHCSVFRKFPKDAPKVADLGKEADSGVSPADSSCAEQRAGGFIT